MGRRAPLLASTSAGGGQVLLPGQLETFGQGRFAVFFADGSWTPPAGVTRARLRVHGGGGGFSYDSEQFTYTHFSGGTASVGALISATGGQSLASLVGGPGGQGFGGDFQASGGAGGAGARSGGGGAGSELGVGGVGGASVNQGGGGGAVGGKAGSSGNPAFGNYGHGASPFEAAGIEPGRDLRGFTPTAGSNNQLRMINTSGAFMPFPMFAFNGYGGRGSSGSGATSASIGGGGGCPAGIGYDGGGGAGGTTAGAFGRSLFALPVQADGTASQNLIHPRGCGGQGGDPNRAGCGGGGYARGVFDVVPGTPLAIVASNGALVIVEW